MARPIPKLNFGEQSRRRDLNLNLDANFRRNERSDTDIRFNEIMNRTGKITIGGREYKTDIDDLELVGELGSGTSGHVVKMKHKETSEIIAVKQMRRSGNADENKRIIMDLEVVLKSHDCPYIVKCLGCIITDSEVWICMELMASCMDKLLKTLKNPLPEHILGKVAVATLNALHYLKESHGVIHRDVKPSNILLDEKGNFKLCDFGISGQLVDSKAKTRSAGCAAYMAPERINPPDPTKPTYDIRADVWSFGITCVEMGTGRFPYVDCSTDFEVMARILDDDPPVLPDTANFSPEFRDFVKLCLAKRYQDRPKYKDLLKHEFIKIHESKQVDVATWYKIYCAPPPSRKTHHHSLGFNNLRHSSRSRIVSSGGASARLGSSAGSPSPITPSPSGRSRQEDWVIQSPRGLRSNFDRLNSDPSPSSARTPSTPGTPSPLQGYAPDPPPRLSRMSSDGLRTPTPTSSSGIGSSSSGSGLLTSPSPTSLSMANSTPSPPDGIPQPPMRRYFPSRLFFTPEPTRKRFFDFTSPPLPPPPPIPPRSQNSIPTSNRFLHFESPSTPPT